MSRAFHVAPLVLLSLAAGCGPAEPQPSTGAKAAPSSTGTKIPAAPVPEDRTPVEAPPGLVVQVHTAGPKAIVHALKPYLPASVPLDPRAIVRELPNGEALEKIVDVDKPVDLAVVLPDPNAPKETPPDVAVAFGVEEGLDLDVALKGAVQVEVTDGGVRRLRALGSKRAPCVVAPSLGAAKYRLICAIEIDNPESGLRLVPWLSRGVTRAAEPASSARLDVDVAALKKRYAAELQKAHDSGRALIGPELKVGHPEIDKVLKRIAVSGIDEAFDLVDDLDAFAIDATLRPEGLVANLSYAFSGKKSWIARAMLSGDGVNGGPPATFAKMPSTDVWFASFGRATPQTDVLLQPVQTMLRDLVEAAATDFKWPAKDKDLALDVVKWAFPAAADQVAVHGGTGHVETKKDDLWGKARDIVRVLTRKSFTVAVVERDSKAPLALAKAVGAWVSRPSFADMFKTITNDRLTVKFAVKDATLKGLPKGALAQQYTIDVSSQGEGEQVPAGPKAKKAMKTVPGKTSPLVKVVSSTLVVPDGARTWTAWGQNATPEELWARVQPAMGGNAPAPLSTKPGYDFLTQGSAQSGIVLLLDGMLRTVGSEEKAAKLTERLPDKGQGAFALRTSAAKGKAETAMLLPRDAIAAVALWFFR
ncbi:MAG: hypothetical protein ACXVEE_17225 [Polyangiales bacterium]